ncbi:TPA: accessory Sec system glycosyltransferase GtfA [Streptococcus suis]|nr:accessory Sec system glycosyltransferase GtfA [Streptococcus suis]
MTIYNINLGIGWASSGVEYAQAYRAQLLRQRGIYAKFIFTDFFGQDNLSDLTRNIGFKDEEIIWLYTFFTDQKVAPITYTLDQLRRDVAGTITKEERNGKIVRFFYEDQDFYLTAYLRREDEDLVHRVEYVSSGMLIRKDFFTYMRSFSEYYTPRDNKAHLYLRRYFNEDGSVAYEEVIDGDHSVFRMPDALLSSKEEWLAYFMQHLGLTDKDIVILDRATGTGQAVFANKGPARLGVVIHAEHYSPNNVTDDTILWNNYYDYQFVHADKVDFFITSTKRQKEVLEEQFARYVGQVPRVIDIPVGSIDQLQGGHNRKSHAMITASRLATEKHVDWLTKAVIAARKELPELTFDIYGSGGEHAKIAAIIKEHQAEDYICLKGHHDLAQVYQDYELYLTASKSEGFGLTLLEAIGSGLPLIGFDAPYGNQTFIQDGVNGYLLPFPNVEDEQTIVAQYCQAICDYFSQKDIQKMQEASYQVAKAFLTSEIEKKWLELVEEMVGP